MLQANYNPDVLSCLANLSNDEVFTPPNLVNDILDLLPTELWSNPNAKFLDPVTKSGVFLREMAKRLMKGLETKIPDKQERINHIFGQQLYGIAITELTSLLSRRSVYCSKTANGNYSICETFTSAQGNIYYERLQHSWNDGKCTYCGASEDVYNREDELETYAYNFIHTDKPEKIFNMKFDVIVGNPPYQLTTGGSVESQATPIYNKFIEQGINLNPRFLIMITPSRWLNGGFGLDKFRDKMLNDNRLRVLVDFLDSRDCFNGVSIKGGVSYFLWDRDYKGDCTVHTYKSIDNFSIIKRPLLEEGCTTFIRYSEAISILNKVRLKNEKSFSSIVTSRDPFGLNYYIDGKEIMFKLFDKNKSADKLIIYSQGWLKNGISYVEKKYVTTRKDFLDKYKVFISKAYGASETFPHQILNKPFIGEPNTCCNMTYLCLGSYERREMAENVISYVSTKFFRYLVSLLKNTQNAYQKVYLFVPMQDFSELWTDEKLYKKYGLTSNEISFIESMIRPMDLTSNSNDYE